MSKDSKYLLDANIFIQAHQSYYAFDIAPSFWEKLIHNARDEKLISIDKIMEELKNGDDNDLLENWATTEFQNWFMSCSNEEVFKRYSQIIDWSQNSTHFKGAAKDEFARSADSWVLAYAKAYNHTIVTHEKYDANNKKRIKIPNVCEKFNISYIDTFTMLRNLDVKIG